MICWPRWVSSASPTTRYSSPAINFSGTHSALILPILYSFRRCPYAMRARMALHASGICHELREVALRNKPESMLAVSPKGSVPVLLLPDGQVIDESRDIMQWALHQHDPEGWLGADDEHLAAAQPLIDSNDMSFKRHLDRYKYADRHPELSREHYREQAEVFLRQLEQRLGTRHYLLDRHFSIADAAIFPFVRQFAEVDAEWFASSPYPALRNWLSGIVSSARFVAIMQKHPPWKTGDTPTITHHTGATAC